SVPSLSVPDALPIYAWPQRVPCGWPSLRPAWKMPAPGSTGSWDRSAQRLRPAPDRVVRPAPGLAPFVGQAMSDWGRHEERALTRSEEHTSELQSREK